MRIVPEYDLKLLDLQRTVEKVDLTLLDLFDIVYRAKIENDDIAEVFGMPNFMRFYDEIQQPLQEEQENSDLNFIELSWLREYKKEHKGGNLESITNQASISPQMEVYGVGEHNREDCPHKNHSNCPKEEKYGIEFSPLNEMANLPIKVNPVIKYENMTINVHPSLYQVINSIFYELTFVGYDPVERNEKAEDLKTNVEEIKEQQLIEEGKEIVKNMFKDDEKTR